MTFAPRQVPTAPRRPLSAAAALALLVGLLTVVSCARQLPTQASAARPRAITAPRLAARALSAEAIVLLAPGIRAKDVASAHGAEVLEGGDSRLAALVATSGDSDDLRVALEADPRVLSVEANQTLSVVEAHQKSWAFDDGLPTLQNTLEQPAATVLGVAGAQAASMGNGVRVAVLDTGVDPTHPLLAGRIVTTADFLDPSNTGAIDLTDGLDNDSSGEADEAWGHGTHVAGIVAVAAPNVELMIGRVLDADGRGDVLGVAAGIRWAVDNGARVINLSLGTTATSHAIEEALEEAEEEGVLVVAAAGNRGTDNPTEYPARSRRAFAVAAADCDSRPTDFTSYGPFVDLVAPGVAIRSSYPGNRYRLWTGTSMAAPWASGTAALLLSVHPQWTPTQVQARLSASASPLREPKPSQHGKLGAGMLDVGAALRPDLVAGSDDDDQPVLRTPR
ncbi:MAG: S8 family peptidase [Candidatus Eisenbacteria bacterium]|nr:S8 family peptidase [Candidatus Eisenbacteria bacterium]